VSGVWGAYNTDIRCMWYVQQSRYAETIRAVQQPNEPKSKSDGGTTEPERIQAADQLVQAADGVRAAGRADLNRKGRAAEAGRHRRGPVHSVPSIPA
jgi:hypothetical protein